MVIKNKKRLLIVDDEEGIRESLALAFEIEGYPVFSACDGAEALEKIRELLSEKKLRAWTRRICGKY